MPARLPPHFGVLVAIACALASVGWLSAFITDDAAITLRYAANLAAGHGIRWNPGEHPVEGYSNFSHVLLGAAALKLGLPALTTLRVLNQLCVALASVVTYALGLRVLGSRLAASAAAVLVAAHPALAYWGSSGLESASYVCACYAGVFAALRLRSGYDLWPALALFAAAITRLEGVVVFGCVVAGLVLHAFFTRRFDGLRLHARWVALFCALYLGYFEFRLAYFGHPLSNSAYFKLRDVTGFFLISQFVAQNGALLALAIFAPWTRLGRFGFMIALLALGYAAGFYGVKDSVADFHRFFLPLVPGLALVATSALVRLARFAALGRTGQAWSAVVFLLALGFDTLHPVSGFPNLAREVALLDTRIVSRAEVAAVLDARVPKDAQIAIDDVGVVGYVLPNPILDLFGLNSEAFIHRWKRDRSSYVRELLAARPAAVVVASRSATRFQAAYATGRVVVTAPDFRRDYAQLTVIVSPAEDYHYFVFARRDLGVLPWLRANPPPQPQRDSLALQIDRQHVAARHPR